MPTDISELKALLFEMDALRTTLDDCIPNLLENANPSQLKETISGFNKVFASIHDSYYSIYADIRDSNSLVTPEPLLPGGKYPDRIMQDVREHMGLDDDDTSRDAEIMSLSRREVLERVTEWDGLIHYADRIEGWIEDIYGVNPSDLPKRETPALPGLNDLVKDAEHRAGQAVSSPDKPFERDL